MNRIFKTLLILLVIAALPLRGLAAIDASCAKGSRLSSVIVSDVTHHQPGITLQSQAGTEPAASGVDHCDGKSNSHAQTHLKNAGCSASACFIGAAAPPFNLVGAEYDTGSDAPTSLSAISFTGHIPTGLERPPRHFLG